MSTVLSLAAFMAVVVAISGMTTGAFVPARGVLPPDPCPRGCGAPNTPGHTCGGTQ